MNEEYQKGVQIGELIAEVKSLAEIIRIQNSAQHAWNKNIEDEVEILKAWVQTTTGKVIVLTAVFGVIGSLFYIGINWIIGHFK